MSKLYLHLTEFGLDKKNSVPGIVKNFSQGRLEWFLNLYADEALKVDLYANELGSTDIYPDSEAGIVPTELVRQLGMYANCFYLHDPLVHLLHKYKTLDSNMLAVAQQPNLRDRIAEFKKELVETVFALLRLRPLADLSYVRFLPTTLYTHVDPSAVLMSAIYGPDGPVKRENVQPLSPAAIEFMQTKMRFLPAELVDGATILHINGELKPSNVIGIQIEGDDPSIYCLTQLRPNPDEAKRKAGIPAIYFDPKGRTPPPPEQFHNWINGERERCLRNRMGRLEHDLRTAARANASFLTTLPSSIELANLNLSQSPKENPVLNTLLQLRLPYFDKVSLEDVARARRNEFAFEEFRVALRKSLGEASAIEDQFERQRRIEEISQDIIRAPLAKIDERMQSLNTKIAVQAVVLTGTLAASLVSGAITLAGAATLAAGVAYRASKVEQEEIKRLPSYFYWDLTKDARKSK